MKPSRNYAVLFDLGDTLIRNRFGNTFDGYMRGFARSAEDALKILGHGIDGLAEVYLREFKLLKKENSPRDFKLEDFVLWLLARETALMDGELITLSHQVVNAIQEWDLEAWDTMPGAPELLEGMLRRGVPIGVVSNSVYSSAHVQNLMAHHGLPRLPLIVSSEQGFAKPAPEIFQAGLDLLGASAESTAFVGDNLEVDIRGALAAGLGRAFLLSVTAEVAEDYSVVRNLSELEEEFPRSIQV
jgi:HAD superfamily hydrolase (TIGR01549 family)